MRISGLEYIKVISYTFKRKQEMILFSGLIRDMTSLNKLFYFNENYLIKDNVAILVYLDK